MKYALSSLLAIIFVLGTACGPVEKVEPPKIVEDITQEAPEQAKNILNNEFVQVISFELPPRVALPMHQGLDRVVYCLSQYRLRFEVQNEQPEVKQFEPGDAHWHAAGMHSSANAGATTAKFITVGRKKAFTPQEKPSELLSTARGYASRVFNNDDVMAVEIGLAAKGRVPKYFQNACVFFAPKACKMKITAGGKTEDHDFQGGEALWFDAGDMSVQNLSPDPVKYLVFEFKE